MIFLCDLSEVLIGGYKTALKDIKTDYGIVSWFKMAKRLKETKEDFENALRGKIDKEEAMKIFFEKSNLPLSKEELEEAFRKSIRKRVPGSWEIISRIDSSPASLKNRNKMVFGNPEIHIITDNTPEHLAFAKKEHPEIFQKVKAVYLSSELGLLKKDAGYFRLLLSIIKKNPDEVLVIDDSCINIDAAKQIGIEGIVYKGNNSFRRQLENLSINLKKGALKGAF